VRRGLSPGLPRAEDFTWRDRGGEPGYLRARHAEVRGDWPAVVAACQQALAADPGHLEASWLLAVGLASAGRPDEAAAPLEAAVVGDPAAWGGQALTAPALAPLWATPAGAALRARLDAARAAFRAALGRGVTVISHGELFVVDAEAPRWYRLTRTGGRVIAALAAPGAHAISYVVRRGRGRQLGLGAIDLSTGEVTAPRELGSVAPLALLHLARGFAVGLGRPRPTWRQLDGAALTTLAKAPPLAAPWLELAGRALALHRLPVRDVSADWDDRGLASALRLAPTGRVVELPSPALVAGETASWSPDHTHLAFVAELDEGCAPRTGGARPARPVTVAYVADAATGVLTEVGRGAGGLAVEWAGDRRIALADRRGVAVVELGGDGPTRVEVPGATSLLTPRHVSRCQPSEEEPAAPADDVPVEDAPSDDEGDR
jgi:hypothetical protein